MLEFLVLGPLELRASGISTPIGGTRQQSLLALLIVNVNQTITFDQVVDELWEDPPVSARQQIHNAVSTLRRILGSADVSGRITTSAAGYRLEADETKIDWTEFRGGVEQARRAERAGEIDSAVAHLYEVLTLWRSSPLPGLNGSAIRNAALRFEELRLQAAEQLMSLQLQHGETTSLVAELQQLVAENPFRELLRGQLMRALDGAGRQADALAVFEQGRRLLVEELGIDPGESLQLIYREIVAAPHALPAAPGNATSSGPSQEAEPAAEGQLTTRNYLPNDPADFSGRYAEMSDLVAKVCDDVPALVISAIDGMGGVGKTTLAVRLAHEVADRYPDGQFFIDLHGFTADMEPISPGEALDSLLRDSGVPLEIIPPSVEGRTAMWRAQTANKRAVVVLDNAAEAAQVRSLLPGSPQSLIIITSRRKLTALDGVESLSLDVLPLEEAVALFTRIIGARRAGSEPDMVRRATELCGRLPLAIRIAASRLRDRARWTVGHLVAKLEDQNQRGLVLAAGDRDVMSVLNLSYRCLRPEQQRVFRLLGLHAGPDFDAYLTAGMADVPLDDADRILEALLDDNLVKQDTVGRYFFHDLIRECARELCAAYETETAVTDARSRLIDYYHRASRLWCAGFGRRQQLEDETRDFVVPTGESGWDALDILNVEYPNVVAAVRVASANGMHRHVWQIVCTLQPYLAQRNYDRNARELFELGLTAARSDGDGFGESLCLRSISAACGARGALKEACGYLDDAVTVSRRIGDAVGEAIAMADLGTAYSTAGDLLAAYTMFSTAKHVSAAANGNPAVTSFITNNLGVVCRDLGRFTESITYLREGLELERANRNEPREISLILWNIGMDLHMRGRHRAALKVFDEGMRISVTTRFGYGQALALTGQSGALRQLGDLDTAEAHGRRALGIARAAGLREVECEAHLTLAEAVFSLGELDRARQVFDQAAAYSTEYDTVRYTARSCEGLAHVAAAAGNHEEAAGLWAKAVQLYPNGLVEATYAQRHLTESEGATECFRCAVADPSTNADVESDLLPAWLDSSR